MATAMQAGGTSATGTVIAGRGIGTDTGRVGVLRRCRRLPPRATLIETGSGTVTGTSGAIGTTFHGPARSATTAGIGSETGTVIATVIGTGIGKGKGREKGSVRGNASALRSLAHLATTATAVDRALATTWIVDATRTGTGRGIGIGTGAGGLALAFALGLARARALARGVLLVATLAHVALLLLLAFLCHLEIVATRRALLSGRLLQPLLAPLVCKAKLLSVALAGSLVSLYTAPSLGSDGCSAPVALSFGVWPWRAVH